MADTLIYDVDKIENLYQDFEKVCKNFKNKEYDDFRSSYFYNCSDSVIVKLRNRIQTIYDNIQKGYDMIDKVWKEYIDDVGNFDKSIASGGNCGIHDGGVSSIVSRICSLDLYDSAGVSTSFKSIAASGKNIGKSILNALSRTGASIVNFVFSIVSGLLKFVEGIVDCVVLIVGAVVGLGVLLVDGGISLFSGKKRNGIDTTKKYFNKLLQCVGYDIVNGQIKDRLYSTGFGKWLNTAYAPFKSDGVGYKVGEAVGEIVGTVVLTVATMGGGAAVSAAKTAATTGTKIGVKAATKIAVKGAATAVKNQVIGTIGRGAAKAAAKEATKVLLSHTAKAQVAAFAVRAAGTMGKKTEDNYKNLIKNGAEKGNLSGSQMAKLVATSGVQAGIDATAYTLTYAGGLKTLGNLKNVNFLTNTRVGAKVTQVAKDIGSNKIANNVITGVLKHESATKAGIQVAKTFANDGVAAAGDIKKFDIKETATDAAINATVSLGHDFVVSKALKKVAGATEKFNLPKNQTATYESANMGNAGGQVTNSAESTKTFGTNLKEWLVEKPLSQVNRVTTYATKNANGKKIIGTALKKPQTIIVDDML